ncbi:hypothetical protein COO60DRAFT_1639284 [Scenedesmus sp. NREL 46B-D3]|nr:hypothetical protein COO60DRAFT_1639284 [Scenedesmus sp. NREL 46B-D3]
MGKAAESLAGRKAAAPANHAKAKAAPQPAPGSSPNSAYTISAHWPDEGAAAQPAAQTATETAAEAAAEPAAAEAAVEAVTEPAVTEPVPAAADQATEAAAEPEVVAAAMAAVSAALLLQLWRTVVQQHPHGSHSSAS